MEEMQVEEKRAESSYNDEDLLVLMSYRDENKQEAEQAFIEFDSRYKNFIWSVCYKVCINGIFESEELAKDVFMQTRTRIYYSAHTYDPSKGKIKTWISRIAKNEMLDLLGILQEKRIGEKLFVSLDEARAVATEDSVNESEFQTPEKKIIDEALNSLTERERDILLTYMLYQDGNRHLPDDMIEELKKRHDTSSANLRMIRMRSMNKVKKFIEDNSDLLK